MWKHLCSTAAAIGFLTVVGAAKASPVPGSGFVGFAGNGDSGVDNYNNPWSWGVTTAGNGVWGIPGLGLGTSDQYDGGVPATDFEISFLHYGSQAIDQTTIGFEATRFVVDGVAWTPVFVSSSQVSFRAPSGSTLNFGDDFFVNVVFDAPIDSSTASFLAVYSFEETIPEPAAIAVLGVGLLGLGLVRRRA